MLSIVCPPSYAPIVCPPSYFLHRMPSIVCPSSYAHYQIPFIVCPPSYALIVYHLSYGLHRMPFIVCPHCIPSIVCPPSYALHCMPSIMCPPSYALDRTSPSCHSIVPSPSCLSIVPSPSSLLHRALIVSPQSCPFTVLLLAFPCHRAPTLMPLSSSPIKLPHILFVVSLQFKQSPNPNQQMFRRLSPTRIVLNQVGPGSLYPEILARVLWRAPTIS